MRYSVKLLAENYSEYLSQHDFSIAFNMSHTSNLATYNEYEYITMMKSFDKLYFDVDSLELTEQFLKGE